MAKRQSSKGVLEWTAESNFSSTAATTTITQIDADLRDDQIGEIYKIESQIEAVYAGEVDGSGQAAMVLSLDPSNAINPVYIDATTLQNAVEDLEVIYNHKVYLDGLLVGTGANFSLNKISEHQVNDFSSLPILFGTNLGWSTRFEETNAGDLGNVLQWIRVFFKRRQATAQELNQILLKRR